MKKLTFLFTAFLSLSNIVTVFAKDIDEWTQYRFNSENNPVITNNSLSDIKPIYSTDDEIRSTLVIVDNKIFVGNHGSGKLYAFSLDKSEPIWMNKAPNWVHSEMIYANKQLFVGYGNRFFQKNSMRGTGESGLLSLDPNSGKILWNFKTHGEVMPTPTFDRNTVYITTGDKHLYAINPGNGKLKWSLSLGSVISMSSPNIKNGILYVGGSSPYSVKAVDLEKRKIKWDSEIEEVMAGLDDVPPVVSDDGIVYTTGVKKSNEPISFKQAYNLGGMSRVYRQMTTLLIGGLIDKKPEMLYSHDIYALDSESGEIVWKNSLGNGLMVENNKSGAPILYDNKIFVGSPITKSFHAFDATSGKQLWKYKSHVNKAPPVANKGVVYFADTKGLIYAFDIKSGKLLGKKMLGGKLAPSGPILVNDNLMIGSQDTNLYSVPTKAIIQANDSI